MKLNKFTNILVIGLTLTVAASGCRKRPYNTTPLYGARTQHVPDDNNPGPIVPRLPAPSGFNQAPGPEGFQSNDVTNHMNWVEDATIFKANTVHFAFDSSVVRASDKANVTAIAEHLKGNPIAAVRVEGHCDERGTAGYNQALGERRAQAVRTELVGLGIVPTRIDTVSYGFDRPVDPGHDESAWSKNRRAEFILLTPPAK